MLKLLSNTFWIFHALEHETVGRNCKDPVMREIWLATADAWRQANDQQGLDREDEGVKLSSRLDSSDGRIDQDHKSL